jgi:hypothetical protein
MLAECSKDEDGNLPQLHVGMWRILCPIILFYQMSYSMITAVCKSNDTHQNFYK